MWRDPSGLAPEKEKHSEKLHYVDAGFGVLAALPIMGVIGDAYKAGKMGLKAENIVNKFSNIAFKNIKYHERVDKVLDLTHNFPRSFDQIIIENGNISQRINDRAYWFELEGYINKNAGHYQIGINDKNIIFHRNFIKKR